MLKNKVALVTGASRGIGRGIAIQLGEAGAVVYVTGRRKADGKDGLPTLEDTANEITRRGGRGIAVYCDHSKPEQVKMLFEQIRREQENRLDILVNNAYSAIDFHFGNDEKEFWKTDDPARVWDHVNDVGLKNHYVCSAYAARIMVENRSGLVVNVSSCGGMMYLFNVAYGVGKAALDRMTADSALELKKHNVACISLWPGAVKTEAVMKGLQEADHPVLDDMRPFFEIGESTEYAGKCVVRLAQDANIMQMTGRILPTRDIADLYGFTDIDGANPRSVRSVKANLEYYKWYKLAGWTPEWLKIPCWMLALKSSNF